MLRVLFHLLLIWSTEVYTGHNQPNLNTKGEKNDETWMMEMQDVAQLSWEYLQDMQFWSWQEESTEEKKMHTDWSLSDLGWNSLQLISDWYKKVTVSRHQAYAGITNNITGLQEELGSRMHGQHLAAKLIVTSLERFLQDEKSQKSLVMSFHGWTGTGKNLAVRIIAENLYKDGQRNQCIRVFIPQLHFPHVSHLEAYKIQLQKHLEEVAARCPQPLFVFDEADKLHLPLFTSLLTFMNKDGAQHSRNIFIFLSSDGGSIINEVTLNFWRAGRQREEITLNDLDRPLKVALKENQGDKLVSHLLTEGVINELVPFLPLERAHVKLCAQDFFVTRGLPYKETILEDVIKDLQFVPKNERVFSATGCKVIAQRVQFYQAGHST
ncbi:torsin-1A [Bombina bombina]|uniref:torsin-1A n=1 Tax=Bombina bombina TaxID=8345 RepID=UPI00235B152C|nr:torsin-1A [Bombina bombina]